MSGTYTLLCRLAEPAEIEVGALGGHRFDAGWYAYTGSAFGPGGFARVARHRDLAAGRRDARHWHVDYLLGHGATTLDAVVATPDRDVECAVARELGAAGPPGFGASDCDCPAHLTRAIPEESQAAGGCAAGDREGTSFPQAAGRSPATERFRRNRRQPAAAPPATARSEAPLAAGRSPATERRSATP